jgi:hypothetical protein
MVIVRDDINVGPHVVHNHYEPLGQGIYLLTSEMSEILVLSPVSRIAVPEHLHYQHEHSSAPTKPDRIRIDRENSTYSRLPCCWHRTCPSILEQGSYRMNISCVHRNVPKDLNVSAEERRHPLLPLLVVLPIEVRKTQTPFLVCHHWILGC